MPRAAGPAAMALAAWFPRVLAGLFHSDNGDTLQLAGGLTAGVVAAGPGCPAAVSVAVYTRRSGRMPHGCRCVDGDLGLTVCSFAAAQHAGAAPTIPGLAADLLPTDPVAVVKPLLLRDALPPLPLAGDARLAHTLRRQRGCTERENVRGGEELRPDVLVDGDAGREGMKEDRHGKNKSTECIDQPVQQ